MPRSFTSVVCWNPLRFLITGSVAAWDPVERQLVIGERTLCVAPDVVTVGVANGVLVTASGHQGDPGTRWIVTDFAFT